jgi:hypothetical protein
VSLDPRYSRFHPRGTVRRATEPGVTVPGPRDTSATSVVQACVRAFNARDIEDVASFLAPDVGVVQRVRRLAEC